MGIPQHNFSKNESDKSTNSRSTSALTQEQIRTRLEDIVKSDFIVTYKLEQQAVKVLLKFVEHYNKDSERYITIAEVRRTFRTVATDEATIIVGEFEKLGVVVGKLYKTQLVFKFNAEFLTKTDIFGEENRQRLEKYLGIKHSRKIDYAKKVLKEAGITTLDEPNVEKTLQEAQAEPEYFTQPITRGNLTALELHQNKKCDTACRFCKMEKGVEI